MREMLCVKIGSSNDLVTFIPEWKFRGKKHNNVAEKKLNSHIIYYIQLGLKEL